MKKIERRIWVTVQSQAQRMTSQGDENITCIQPSFVFRCNEERKNDESCTLAYPIGWMDDTENGTYHWKEFYFQKHVPETTDRPMKLSDLVQNTCSQVKNCLETSLLYWEKSLIKNESMIADDDVRWKPWVSSPEYCSLVLLSSLFDQKFRCFLGDIPACPERISPTFETRTKESLDRAAREGNRLSVLDEQCLVCPWRRCPFDGLFVWCLAVVLSGVSLRRPFV